MRRLALAVLLALVPAWVPAAAHASGPVPPLGHVGRWIVDADGRVVVLHGVNMVYKRAPYEPAAAGFGADDARFLAENGFDTVRLGVILKGVEPRPHAYDDAYLASIRNTQQVLADHGIYSLLDFHQDMYNERFQGEGFPDWMVEDDGLPAQPQLGFPGNYLAQPATIRAFDHFWANSPGPGGIGLQDYYAQAWRHVASGFAASPYVLGYDLFNEPWPGSVWPTCANPLGCPAFDRGPLASMTRRSTQAIRQVDDTHIVWQEPEVIFNYGADSSLPRIGADSGFSFHDYCLPHDTYARFLNPDPTGGLDCAAFDGLVFKHADEQSAQTGQALLLSEFGATPDPTVLKRVTSLADQHMVSWQYWHYCECDDPTTSGTGVQGLIGRADQPPTGANVDRRRLRLLETPYPQATAGTPLGYHYDRATGVFRFSYSTRTPSGFRLPASETTQVFVPPIQYPRGYRVSVDGATVVSPSGSSDLELQRDPGADRVTVAVWRAG
jgi:endoglycosylceramidase